MKYISPWLFFFTQLKYVIATTIVASTIMKIDKMKTIFFVFFAPLLVACQQTPSISGTVQAEPSNTNELEIIQQKKPIPELVVPTIEFVQPRSAEPVPGNSVSKALLGEEFETCKSQLDILRLNDKRLFNIYNKRLNENVSAINAYQAISATLPKETSSYLEYQHRLALNITCTKIQGAVNKAVVSKVPSLYF